MDRLKSWKEVWLKVFQLEELVSLNLVIRTSHSQRLVDGGWLPGRRVDHRAGQGLWWHYVQELQVQLGALSGHITPRPGVLAGRVAVSIALETIRDPHCHYVDPTDPHWGRPVCKMQNRKGLKVFFINALHEVISNKRRFIGQKAIHTTYNAFVNTCLTLCFNRSKARTVSHQHE